MLTHQARRFNSPAFLVTNNDARFFPNLKLEGKKKNFKFDRILCDVPCSGDGTLRKNVGLWRRWTETYALNHHCLQLDILRRGFQMLKKGGRLIYSTCSFNTIENEAVIAAALKEFPKQMELVDMTSEIHPEFKYRPGLTSWSVFHRGKGKRFPARWFTEYSQTHGAYKKTVKESMFSAPYSDFNNEEGRKPED